MRPFELFVWQSILISLVAMPFLIWAMGKVEGRLGLDVHYWNRLSTCILYVSGTFLKEIIRTKGYFGDSWATR